jgi:hypothetical protein
MRPARSLSTSQEKSRERVVVVSGWGSFARNGLLLTYGPNVPEIYRSLARYVDRILRGTKAADLPVELPTRFELVSIAAVMQTRSRKVEMPSGLSLPLAFAIYTVVEVGALLDHGHPEVVDADLADYFGSIPHAELLKSVARRIVDRRVLHLIKMWLDCPVEETDDRGRKTRTTEARDNRRGTPQGLPISRLVSL